MFSIKCGNLRVIHISISTYSKIYQLVRLMVTGTANQLGSCECGKGNIKSGSSSSPLVMSILVAVITSFISTGGGLFIAAYQKNKEAEVKLEERKYNESVAAKKERKEIVMKLIKAHTNLRRIEADYSVLYFRSQTIVFTPGVTEKWLEAELIKISDSLDKSSAKLSDASGLYNALLLEASIFVASDISERYTEYMIARADRSWSLKEVTSEFQMKAINDQLSEDTFYSEYQKYRQKAQNSSINFDLEDKFNSLIRDTKNGLKKSDSKDENIEAQEEALEDG
ncbi:hypothetical protein VMC_26570 [Vibrio alginolyticus 40B]|nr:hypothetical protein VMC_26570 [Vibrio alginolyticus 40B]